MNDAKIIKRGVASCEKMAAKNSKMPSYIGKYETVEEQFLVDVTHHKDAEKAVEDLKRYMKNFRSRSGVTELDFETIDQLSSCIVKRLRKYQRDSSGETISLYVRYIRQKKKE